MDIIILNIVSRRIRETGNLKKNNPDGGHSNFLLFLATQHLQGAQMGGSVVGVPAHSMATSAGSSTVGIAGPSGHSAAMSKRERKRKIAAADAATAAAMAAGEGDCYVEMDDANMNLANNRAL